jgi:hypothetical protein
MRIEASQVSYVATHRSESATAVVDQTLARPRAATQAVDTVQLSAPAWSSGRDDLQDLDPKQRLAVLAIEALLGHRVTLLRFHPGAEAAPDAAGAQATGTAEVHRRVELHYEAEQTTLQAQGVVETADGRRIQFSVELAMQREFQSASVTTRPGNAADPLVVNFGGTPARLTGAKVSFDLNSDGQPESISFVAAGSGFLALDRNGDGKVNDGSELFGPRTGNGFAELATYDADDNGWIDENDPVFGHLRIWTQGGLYTLSQKGIGALAASSAETPFTLKDAANLTQGEIRGTGIYLSEPGAPGTIQQVDLAQG